jgi:catechol 2,3-dioxygenase-like lactoylglutathione lyase family enzyme
MVRAIKTFGSFAVDDIDAARTFYRDRLGLNTEEQDGAHLAVRQSRLPSADKRS